DSERVDGRELARIDHDVPLVQPAIELVEQKRRILRTVKRGDDVALVLGRDDLRESHRAHAGQEPLAVGAVASRAARDAALLIQLVERAVEREQDVRRRREAELTVAFEPTPLRREVERDAASGAALEERPPRDHERAARYSLEALVGRGRERIDVVAGE